MPTYYNYLGQAMPVSANPAAMVYGTSAGHETLTAPTGPSGVSVGGGNYSTLIGSSGDNTFYVNNITDVVQVASGLPGVKTVVSYSGGYTLPANVQNLTFYGAGNWGAGNGLNNLIVMGGNDQNTMDGGGGNDVLVGGFGQNKIQFEVGGGHDVVYNFHTNLDQVRITGSSLTTFAQIQAHLSQVGSDVVLTIDADDSITFRGVNVADFQAKNFLMPLDRSQLGALTFSDDFNSLQLWNASTGQGLWQTTFGQDPTTLDNYAITSNDEKQLYTSPGFVGKDGYSLAAYNPFSIDNGVLNITAGKFSYADSQHTWGQAYYSGMLNTRGLFMQQYGYFEMRAALPTTLGSWPAFWLSQDPFKPGVEADVLEHLAMYPDVNFARSNDGGKVTGSTTYMPALSGFHTYGMLWGATTTTFYIDDVAVMQVATPASWDKPMYMLLDLAIGGWGGPIDANGMPTQMQVDYVHVYGLANAPVSGGGSIVGGGSNTGPAPSVATDASSYTAPAGVTDITLTGSAQTVTGNDAGDTFHSNNTGNHLVGGAGADVFLLGRGGDTAAGGAGADRFVFAETPWAGAQITDFVSGTDRIDVSGLLTRAGYSGSNPIADGYLKVVDGPSGQAQIWSNLDHVSPGAGWYLVATLTSVSSGGLHAGDIVFSGGAVSGVGGVAAGGSTGGSGSSVSTSTSSYTAPAGVTDITLTGSAQTVTGNDAGDIFRSNNTGNHLVGGTGADTFLLGRGGDVAVGGAGADRFVFAETPWAVAHITDFNAQDLIDLSGLLARSGYTGSDPVGAGYIRIADDGAGHAEIWSNLNPFSADGNWYGVAILDGVAAPGVQVTGSTVVAVGGTGSSVGSTTAQSVSTGASPYVAPAGVTDITLTGSAQTVTGNDAGDTFHSNNTGNRLIGGAGADTFLLGRGGDVVTGGAGADTFAFAETPWAAARITDFAPGQDQLDLTGLLAKSGYAGSNAIGDGYIKITADGSGSAQIWSNLEHVSPGAGWWEVATLTGISSNSVQLHGAFVTG